MFAKRAKPSSQRQPPADGGSQTAQSGADLRDEKLAQLTLELDEQRALATALREQLDAATFKIEILEKSYAKQLAEARDKAAATDAELTEKNDVLANLGGGHEHTLRELNDALTVIKVLKKERDQLRKVTAQGVARPRGEVTKARALLGDDAHGMPPVAGDGHRAGRVDSSADDTSGGTINALIANAGWAEKKPSGVGSGHGNAQVATPEAPQAEMIAPDLVFTERDKDDER
jgi:chromosome segregation ATPase